MKILGLHHVGIICPNMQHAQNFMLTLGLEQDYCEYVEEYQSDCIFLKSNEHSSPIELVVPHGGVLAKFNEGKGGLHHIALTVDNCAEATAEYKQRGMSLLEDIPVVGAGGILVNFLRPRYTGGVLVEFVENPV